MPGPGLPQSTCGTPFHEIGLTYGTSSEQHKGDVFQIGF